MPTDAGDDVPGADATEAPSKPAKKAKKPAKKKSTAKVRRAAAEPSLPGMSN
jgi:hypothetical protein